MVLLALKAAAVWVIIKTVGYKEAKKIIKAIIQPPWLPSARLDCSQHTMVQIRARTIMSVISADEAASPFLFATMEPADHVP